MADNITTVPGLPEADFETTGHPEENLLYLVQGTGADRDRRVPCDKFFEWLMGKKTMTADSVYARVGDILFKVEETKGGKLLTAYIMDGRTLEKPTVSGGMKADSIEGTNQGQGTTKYLVLGNTTVNGDLDVKGKAILGNGLFTADPDELKASADGDMEVSGKFSAGSVETSGKVKGATAEFDNAVKASSLEIGGGDHMATATCAKDESDPTGKSVEIDAGMTLSGALSARYDYETTNDATYSLVAKWSANADDHAGRILMLYNAGSVQCKVTISASPSASGTVARRTVLLNSGNVGAFIRVGWYGGNSMFAPVSFSRVVTSTEEQ